MARRIQTRAAENARERSWRGRPSCRGAGSAAVHGRGRAEKLCRRRNTKPRKERPAAGEENARWRPKTRGSGAAMACRADEGRSQRWSSMETRRC